MDDAWSPTIACELIPRHHATVTAAPELVAAELNVEHVTAADIGRWLEQNRELVCRSALVKRLCGLIPGESRIIRLEMGDLKKMPPKQPPK